MATNSPLSVAQSATASGQKGKQSNGALAITSDIMDDLASRFIINVPEEERKNLIRICFQMELAHWFYLDFYCAESKHKCGIKQFAQQMFKHVPFLQPHAPNVDSVLEDWKQYKLSVPTYGAILLSEDMRHVLLVQSFWAKSSWGFPKGKINENEEPVNCAIREVYEETGYDIRKLIVPTEYIDVIINYQFTRLYLVPGVPLTTVFVPKTRNEIKCCEWFPVDTLPVTKHDNIVKGNHSLSGNSFFMILPFVKRLKKWLDAYHSGKGAGKGKGSLMQQAGNSPVFGRDSTGKQQQGQKQQQRQRHKSMGELEQHPPIQILQRGKGNAAGTPNVRQPAVATHSSAHPNQQQQQQQQKQTPRDDPNRSQRAASVATESYNEFRFGIGDSGPCETSKISQMVGAGPKNEPTGGPSLSAASNGGRTERVINSQTKRKLFANEPNTPNRLQVATAKPDGTETGNKTDEKTVDEMVEWLMKQGRTRYLGRDVQAWTSWALDWLPFVNPELARKIYNTTWSDDEV